MDATAIIATITPPAEQVPTDFMSYLNNTKQNDYTRLCDFAIDTLSFSTKVNIFHWTCEKGFLHSSKKFTNYFVSSLMTWLKEFLLRMFVSRLLTDK